MYDKHSSGCTAGIPVLQRRHFKRLFKGTVEMLHVLVSDRKRNIFNRHIAVL